MRTFGEMIKSAARRVPLDEQDARVSRALEKALPLEVMGSIRIDLKNKQETFFTLIFDIPVVCQRKITDLKFSENEGDVVSGHVGFNFQFELPSGYHKSVIHNFSEKGPVEDVCVKHVRWFMENAELELLFKGMEKDGEDIGKYLSSCEDLQLNTQRWLISQDVKNISRIKNLDPSLSHLADLDDLGVLS